MHLLIPWARLRDHEDPVEVEFTYGNVGRKGKKLRRDLAKGDYVFFHGMVYGRKCISSYYVVDRVLPVRQAVSDPNIMAKYRNPHLGEVANWRPVRDEVVLFGDPILSRKLARIFHECYAAARHGVWGAERVATEAEIPAWARNTPFPP